MVVYCLLCTVASHRLADSVMGTGVMTGVAAKAGKEMKADPLITACSLSLYRLMYRNTDNASKVF
jgi:hypothetical protein